MSSFLNIDKFKSFLKEKFNDNLTIAEKETGIPKSTLCLLRKGERDIGKNTLRKLKDYCKKNDIKVDDLLFF